MKSRISKFILPEKKRVLRVSYRPTWDQGIFFGLVLLSLSFRLWELSDRPFHYDESLHAIYSWELFTGMGYRYEAWTHGPMQFFLNALSFSIFSDTDFSVRLPYALAGSALVGLPYFLRKSIGLLGSVAASLMLMFSPSLLYFSRYSRNDIYAAFFALALFILLWRYMHERKDRYLYLTAAVLAGLFITKETTFILLAIFFLMLTVISLTDLIPLIQRRIRLKDLNAPGSFLILMITLTLPQWSAISAVFVTMFDSGIILANDVGGSGSPIGLPLWQSPFWSMNLVKLPLFMDLFIIIGIIISGIIALIFSKDIPEIFAVILIGIALLLIGYSLLAFVETEFPRNYWIAGFVIGSSFLLSALIGITWRLKVWAISAAIFYGIWLTFYTSFFGLFAKPYTDCPNTLSGLTGHLCAHLGGAFTGIWQSLGYWVVQQDVARGNQPWYYYFVLGSLYEFLPLILGSIGLIYYIKKGNIAGLFLGFWAGATFLMYTVAGEKMPWLIVNITLPFIVLSAYFISDLFRSVAFSRPRPIPTVIIVVLTPGIFVLVAFLFEQYLDNNSFRGLSIWLGVVAAAAGILALIYSLLKVQLKTGMSLIILTSSILLLIATGFVGYRATYNYDDEPVEMLVYAGGSSDVRFIAEKLRDNIDLSQSNQKAIIDYDVWYPFNWYSRNDEFITYRCFKNIGDDGYASYCDPLHMTPDAQVLVMSESHGQRDDRYLAGSHSREGPYRNLIWFPEVYRRPGEARESTDIRDQMGQDIAYGWDVFTDQDSWRNIVNYLFHRELTEEWFDSTFYAFFPKSP
ncbi:MAG: hypothetical protein CL891_05470 [Dehalococcoidia bacterium]|nr:hypothetical protein [Dehalococcoidia bacterium]